MKNRLKAKNFLPRSISFIMAGITFATASDFFASLNFSDNAFSNTFIEENDASINTSENVFDNIISQNYVENNYVNKDVNINLKLKVNSLIKKHFKEKDWDKISVYKIISENDRGLEQEIALSIFNVSNKYGLLDFLTELLSEINISVLNIDSQTLAKLESFEFRKIEKLIIENPEPFIGLINLDNFSNLKSLSLEKVIVNNMPSTIKEIKIDGSFHKYYNIAFLNEQFPNLKFLEEVEFYNMSFSDIVIPNFKKIYIKFFECYGNINLQFVSSEHVYVENFSYDTNLNNVIINGNISESLYICALNSKIGLGNIIGSPKIYEVPNNLEESKEALSLARRKNNF